MQAQFDDMFKQINAAAQEVDSAPQPPASATASASAAQQPKPSTSSASKPAAAAAAAAAADPIADGSFQETIRKTMERMQASGDQATAAAAESSTEDFLAEMMKQLGDGNMDGAGSEEEFSKMLMGMMEQLTNKEILYEPMKELNDKFPEWLEKNREKTPAEDLKRYEEQQALVKEIVAKFEEKTYADGNAADREYIVDRMQKVSDLKGPKLEPTPLTQSRCKPPDRHLRTWLEICHQHRKHSTQTRVVIRNNRKLAAKIQDIPFIFTRLVHDNRDSVTVQEPVKCQRHPGSWPNAKSNHFPQAIICLNPNSTMQTGLLIIRPNFDTSFSGHVHFLG